MSTVDQMKMPAPHSVTAASRKSSRLPSFDQSSGSNRPSLQPRISSGDSTSTTSQLVWPVSAMTLILAISPLYSAAWTIAPVCLAKGW
ncbi:hypothetical protein D9M71_846170 [compost metagenome]